MKKTLVALAALAAVGGAFAQSSVSLTGKFGAAYTSSNSGAVGATTASGFGVTDGNIVFAATEDLGGGLTAGASLDVQVRGRRGAASAASDGGVTTTLSGVPSNSVDGRDATVYVQGGFGRITLGAIEAGNGIIGLASAGAPTIGQDTGVVLDGAGNVDFASYTGKFGDVTATVMLIDSIGAPAAAGMESTATTADATLLGLAYASGPVTVKGDYTSFGKNAITTLYPENRTRISGTYDFGVVKLGAGYQVKNSSTVGGVVTTNNDKQYMLGVNAPLGAFTVGATYAVRNNESNAADAKGWELGANYALSKRTGIQMAYRSQKLDTVAAGVGATTLTRIRLLHSF